MHTVSRLLCRHSLLGLYRRRDLPGLSLTTAPCRDESGSTLVLVTMFIIALFGFAALTIDVGRVYKEKRHAQFGTDAGAYAAANLLTNSPQTLDQIKIEAINIAAANGVTNTEISNAGTVELGHWDANTLAFTAG